MKLHTVNRKVAMLQAHDFLGRSLSCDFEFIWQGFAPDNERMITRGFQRLSHAGKNATLVVPNAGALTVHECFRAHDLSPEHLRDALVAKTNAQQWNVTAEIVDHGVADAGGFGTARTRRNTNTFRSRLADIRG